MDEGPGLNKGNGDSKVLEELDTWTEYDICNT